MRAMKKDEEQPGGVKDGGDSTANQVNGGGKEETFDEGTLRRSQQDVEDAAQGERCRGGAKKKCQGWQTRSTSTITGRTQDVEGVQGGEDSTWVGRWFVRPWCRHLQLQ